MNIMHNDTFEPTTISIELRYSSDPEMRGYFSQLSIGISEDTTFNLHFITGVFESDSIEAIRKTLIGVSKLFPNIQNDVYVYDVDTGEVIEKLELNHLFIDESELHEETPSKMFSASTKVTFH